LHAKPQLAPEHVGIAFAGVAQGVQAPPQLATLVSFTHSAPHEWNPVSHTTAHAPAVHVACPFVGAGNTVAHAPQWFASICRFEHDVPHTVRPVAQLATHIAAPPPTTQRGVGAVQALPHEPQVVAVSSRASQPSPVLPLQSP